MRNNASQPHQMLGAFMSDTSLTPAYASPRFINDILLLQDLYQYGLFAWILLLL